MRISALFPLVLLSSLWAALPVGAQGPLAPPPKALAPNGDPQPHLKTMDQVEGRIPISTPQFSISQPGSYYLTRNIVIGQNQGVVIRSPGVTLDLNGFEILGNGSILAYAVTLNRPVPESGVTIRNGTLRRCCISVVSGVRGMTLSDLTIIEAPLPAISVEGLFTGSVIRDCRILNTDVRSGAGAITLDAQNEECSGNVIERCTISGTTSSSGGFNPAFAGLAIDAWDGAAHGNLIRSCTITESGTRGLVLRGSCTQNVVEQCVIQVDGASAVEMLSPDALSDEPQSGNTFSECTLASASGLGLKVSAAGGMVTDLVLRDCEVSSQAVNGIGIEFAATGSGVCRGTVMQRCRVRGDPALSMTAASPASIQHTSLTECTFEGDGVRISDAQHTRVAACVFRADFNAGLDLTRCRFGDIRGCTVFSAFAGTGIEMDECSGFRVDRNRFQRGNYAVFSSATPGQSTGNLFIRNQASDVAGSGFTFGSADVYGPKVVRGQGALPTTGSATHPWQNLSTF